MDDRPVTGVTLSPYSPRDSWYFRHPQRMLDSTHFDVPLTTVLDRVDNRERSLQIINVLGLPEKQLQLQKDSNLQLDATIVLGADYKKLIPFK